MAHKAGFVNIIGKPNTGKSTLMNAMVGEKLSIITKKAQTTRHRILGIVNKEEYQIVFSDTPGILRPTYKLQESMLREVKSALTDADILLYMIDVKERPDDPDEIRQKIKKTSLPVLLLINKIDLSNEEDLNTTLNIWKNEMPLAEIFPLSALHNFNIDNLFKRIIELLPESPPYFPKDDLTDKSEKFFASEIIREKILLNYKQEVPYSVEVEIESFKETDEIIKIAAVIYVMRDSQKGIIIGNKGEALKKTGTAARIDMESFFNKKVFLEMFVKVRKDWRDKDNFLRQFGYTT